MRQNITAFDGDLGRITICGKSAGGLPEYALFTDPSTRSRRPGHHGEHLLHHLIARGGTSPGRFHRRQARLHRRLLSTEQERGADPGRRGCYAPIVHEAPSLPVDHKDAVRTDRSSHVPVLIGSNADEARSFALSFIGATKQQ
ncbi:hypothetical protein ACIPSJ_49445 [Streptomyces sp. NPDC090088]|uniref:hypothetical protein n=1 Tax=Streptomyces sp. NPDC090088 TaxID=3365944 RepID=UPI003815A7E5